MKGKILNVTNKKPKKLKGKTYKWHQNKRNKTWVKVRTKK